MSKGNLITLVLLALLVVGILQVSAQEPPRYCTEDSSVVGRYGVHDNFADNWHFYTSNKGDRFLLVGTVNHNLLFYSSDGINFEELCQTGSGPNNFPNPTASRINFYNPTSEIRGTVVIHYQPRNPGEPLVVGDILEYNGIVYTLGGPAIPVNLIALPEVYVPLALYSFGDNDYLYLSVNRYHYSRNNMRLMLVTPEGGYDFDITKVMQYSDGKSYVVVTTEGTLHDTPLQEPKWGDVPLTTIDPNTCNITEIGGTVHISCE